MNGVNATLSMLVILIGTISFAGWMSPSWLRRAAARFLARAESIEAAGTAHKDGLKYWNGRLERARAGNLIAMEGDRS